MAKKKKRQGLGPGGPEEPRGPEPQAPVTVETPAAEVDVPLPSWRWHLYVFLGCLAASALVLYGGYVPLMRYHSNKYMALGDEYLAWAKKFDEDPARAETFSKHFDAINEILAPMGKTLREFQENWNNERVFPSGAVETDRSKQFRQEFTAYVEGVKTLKARMDAGAQETRLYEEVPSVEALVESRYAAAADGVGELSKMQLVRSNSQLLWPYVDRFKLFLEAVVQFRNCFDRETALDQAMSAYLDAVGFGRRRIEPRMRLADLYALRGWGDMAGEEYAKVVRLDPSGAGAEAVEKIRALCEKDREVCFHLGVALLARGENEEAAKAFDTLLEWAPGSLYGPRSEQLAGLARSGNGREIEDFLADQVWL